MARTKQTARQPVRPRGIVKAARGPRATKPTKNHPVVIISDTEAPSVIKAETGPAVVIKSTTEPISVVRAAIAPTSAVSASTGSTSLLRPSTAATSIVNAASEPTSVVRATIAPSGVARAVTESTSVLSAANELASIPGPRSEGYLASKSRIRVMDLLEAKKLKEKWAMLTSYDTISARIFDQARIPCILVGDSASQMVYGYKSTLPVTMDELIPLARAVSSSCTRALVIADLPFGSYQESPETALAAASRFMKESQVHGIKLEGGKSYENHVKLLVQSGIPVMGHIGFTPQSEHALSGFKIQGRDPNRVRELTEDALALERAGAFACVLELMPSDAGKSITQCLQIPTIGIGAGADCDAQVLVWHDMAGFSAPNSSSYLQGAGQDLAATTQPTSTSFKPSRVPKFVKQYANMGAILFEATKSYARDVSLGLYPGKEHSYDS